MNANLYIFVWFLNALTKSGRAQRGTRGSKTRKREGEQMKNPTLDMFDKSVTINFVFWAILDFPDANDKM